MRLPGISGLPCSAYLAHVGLTTNSTEGRFLFGANVDNPSYYGILPADVRYDERLCPMAKIIYTEITALQDQKGYAWPSNGYFAKLYSVDSGTVSGWVAQLVKCGFVKMDMIKTEKGTARRMWTTSPIERGGVQEMPEGGGGGSPEKAGGGSPEKAGPNTKELNTKELNILTPSKPKKTKDPEFEKQVLIITDYYRDVYMQDHDGIKPEWGVKNTQLVRGDMRRLGKEILAELIWRFFEHGTTWVKKNETGMGYNVFHSQIDALLEKKRRAS